MLHGGVQSMPRAQHFSLVLDRLSCTCEKRRWWRLGAGEGRVAQFAGAVGWAALQAALWHPAIHVCLSSFHVTKAGPSAPGVLRYRRGQNFRRLLRA